MLNICMSSKSTLAYSWRKNLLGVIRGTDPSAGSGSPAGTLHEAGRVTWKALACLPEFMLFLRCLKQVSCTCSQVLDLPGLFTSILWLEYKYLLSAPSVTGLARTSTKRIYLAHSFSVSAVPAILLLTVSFPDC